jgi:hypothetical protein
MAWTAAPRDRVLRRCQPKERSTMDFKLEVVVIPVSDVDQAKDVASVRGPDGNTWVLQEVTSRLPGR